MRDNAYLVVDLIRGGGPGGWAWLPGYTHARDIIAVKACGECDA